MLNILITGANGFIGHNFVNYIKNIKNFNLILGSRYSAENYVSYGEINGKTNWTSLLQNCDVVIHLASVVHKKDALDTEYNTVNVYGTRNLVQQSIKAKIKKFIYVSTAKVNGEESSPGKCFNELSKPNPESIYAKTKFEAEETLIYLCRNTEMKYVIVRPPMVYGPNSKGIFNILKSLIRIRIPLPVKGINNERNFLFVNNLSSFLLACIYRDEVNDQIFLISDHEKVKILDVINTIGSAMGIAPRCFYIPNIVLDCAENFPCNVNYLKKLRSDFCIDSSKAQDLISWSPPYSFSEGINQSINN